MAKGGKRKNADPVPTATTEDFLVVGIGASAGGIHALKTFFSNVPRDSGNAYVVILHLSPEYDSQLAQVLQTSASIPVRQVKDTQVRVEPDHVYVISPNHSLTINDGHLATEDLNGKEERRAPVDLFFRTLAESHKNHAVSVVLTGTGPNGSMGIKRVKEMGGIVVAQDPDEAEYPDMPRNSIATGLVDYILPVEKIPEQINEYRSRLGKAELPAEHIESVDEKNKRALAEIFVLLRTRTGHDFTNYKRATVLRRLERRMNVHGKRDLPTYVTFLRENPTEAQALLKDLLISVTNFFRDPDAFAALESDIIPKIFNGRTESDPIRVWVAGCATGEEAYSIAMLLAEKLADQLEMPPIQIFATDIDEAAVAQGRAGLYSESDVADVSPERLRMFFQREGEKYRVRRETREMVLFAAHNITKDPAFSRLDLVTCRNLLIYLNRQAQVRVMETMHFALKPGGYLFLGSSESADTDENLFVPVDKDHRIYQSRPIAARLSIPVPDLSPAVMSQRFQVKNERSRTEEIRALERLSYTALHHRLLEQYAPPSIVVNGEYDIVHISERAGRYLQMAGGEPSKNLLNIARPELRLELRTALYQATQRGVPVTVSSLGVKTEDDVETVNIIVRPVTDTEDPNRGFILVIFEPSIEKSVVHAETLTDGEPIARQLERELLHTKSQLRSTVEQYEVQHEELKASNEELHAINEELRSAAEEIETSKEELQSVNEELSTVNQELKIKIEELSQANNDFLNLMNSTDLGTIFLDRRLRVKLFTEAATSIFNLIPADVGRPLSDLRSTLKSNELVSDAEKVLKDLQPVEREVEATDGNCYMVRVMPYRTGEDHIAGVVITFVDITRRLKQESQLRESRDRMSEVLENIAEAFYSVDADFNFMYVNRKAEEIWGRPHHSLEGKNLWQEFPQLVGTEIYEKHKLALKEKQPIHFETRPISGEGLLNISLYPDKRDGLSCLFRDITGRRKTETEALLREEQLRLIVESATDYAIFSIDDKGRVTSWNTGAQNTFGYTRDEMMGQLTDILFIPEDRRRKVPQLEMKTALDKGRSEDERWHLRKDGTQFFASGVMQPLRSDGVLGFVKICRDQTDKLEAQTAIRERGMLKRLVEAQEEERQRIARDLHDNMGQHLTALRLKLEGLKANYAAEPAMMKAIDETQAQAKRVDDEVSFMTWELRPTALDNLGLKNALGNFVKEWSKNYGVDAEFHSARSRRTRLTPEAEINLYRIAQEALNNVVKHAKASKADVMLEYGQESVVLVIEDNGQGFDVKAAERTSKKSKRLGLVGMRERAALLGGTLEIESARLKGTTVIARIPVRIAGAR